MMVVLLSFLAATIVMLHCFNLIAKLNPRNWLGHKLQFAGLAAAYASLAGGAVGTALGYPHSATLLLFGVAGIMLFDRRIRA